MYLRQGRWCECERSFNTAAGTFEAGVSVFECDDAQGGKWRGIGPAFAKHEKAFRGQQRTKLGGVGSIWFLVDGEVNGTGADKEPLLKNVIPRKIVAWDGSSFFLVTGEPTDDCHDNHPDYPECKCESIDDLLART